MAGRAYKYTPNLELPLHWNDGGMVDGHLHNLLAEKIDDGLGSVGLGWKNPVATFLNLPVLGNDPGDARVVLSESRIYIWNGSMWVPSNEGALTYQGVWDAATNTPTLADGTGTKGYYYVVSAAGTQNLGSGPISFAPGDWVVHNGTVWQKADHTDTVTSVFGRQGAVVAVAGDYAASQITDDSLWPGPYVNTTLNSLFAHRGRHISGGADAFLTTDLIEAVVRRIRESGGPTDLLVGAIADGAGLKRSGSTIVGDLGVSFRCWSMTFGGNTAPGYNSSSVTPKVMRRKTFPGTNIVGSPVRACATARSSSGNNGYVAVYRPSTGTILLTIGPITALTPTVYSVTPPWTNPWPTTEEVLEVRVYRGAGAATITVDDFTAGTY